MISVLGTRYLWITLLSIFAFAMAAFLRRQAQSNDKYWIRSYKEINTMHYEIICCALIQIALLLIAWIGNTYFELPGHSDLTQQLSFDAQQNELLLAFFAVIWFGFALLTLYFVVEPWLTSSTANRVQGWVQSRFLVLLAFVLGAFFTVQLEFAGGKFWDAINQPIDERVAIGKENFYLMWFGLATGVGALMTYFLHLLASSSSAERDTARIESTFAIVGAAPHPNVLSRFHIVYQQVQSLTDRNAPATARIVACNRALITLLKEWDQHDEATYHASVARFFRPDQIDDLSKAEVKFINGHIDRESLAGFLELDGDLIEITDTDAEGFTSTRRFDDIWLPVHSFLVDGVSAPESGFPPLPGAPAAVSGGLRYVEDTLKLGEECRRVFGEDTGTQVSAHFEHRENRFIRSMICVPLGVQIEGEPAIAVLTLGSSAVCVLKDLNRVRSFLNLASPLLHLLTVALAEQLAEPEVQPNNVGEGKAFESSAQEVEHVD